MNPTINSTLINEKLANRTKKQKRTLIVFFIIALSFLGWAIYITTKKLPDPKSLEKVTANGEKTEGEYLYLDMIDKPYLFAEYDDSNYKYYFVYDENDYLYIVRINEKKYNDFKARDDVKRITGIGKLISNDVKQIGLEVFNDEFDLNATMSEFDGYVGYLYLDTVDNYNDASLQYLGAIAFGTLTLIMVISILLSKRKIKKIVNSYQQDIWNKIESELNSPDEIFNDNIYFTKNYLVNLSENFDIIKYTDIVWTYFIHQSYNGVSTNRQVVALTVDNKLHQIYNFAAFSKKRKDQVQELIEIIASKDKNIIVGFSEENRQEAIKRTNS